MQRLEPLKTRSRQEFDADAYLRDIVERNLQIAVQCCIDIANRIIALRGARKPVDYYEAIAELGELGVLPTDFARRLAPLAGLRNILVHEYVRVNWDRIYQSLQQIDELKRFLELVRRWALEYSDQGAGYE